MFVRQPQFRNANADVQVFYGARTDGTSRNVSFSWNKPPGVSQIYMLLIGAGANGDGTSGGGSGAVTTWWGSARNVPDSLRLRITRSEVGGGSFVYSPTDNTSTGYVGALIYAQSPNADVETTGGAAASETPFMNSGLWNSVAGQAGSSGSVSASGTTFLSGGAASTSTTANYGYVTTGQGAFFLSPMIVGLGGLINGNGGIGCGGGSSTVTAGTGLGGPGMILIASW